MNFTWLAANSTTGPFHWLVDLFTSHDRSLAVAHAVLIFALVIASGLALGSVRIFKISLGISGVLFSGLAFAHFGLAVDEGIVEFARDFGLILFVYTIGLQVGPGFASSLRKAGLPLNLMAAGIVLLGVATTLGVVFVSEKIGRPIPIPTAVGLLAGGTTNTPSLAAAQQAEKENAAGIAGEGGDVTKLAEDAASQTVRGYALAYPFGVVGIIGTMLLLRMVFKVNVSKENELFAKLNLKGSGLLGMNLLVSNPNLEGKRLGDIPQLTEGGVVISRVL